MTEMCRRAIEASKIADAVVSAAGRNPEAAGNVKIYETAFKRVMARHERHYRNEGIWAEARRKQDIAAYTVQAAFQMERGPIAKRKEVIYMASKKGGCKGGCKGGGKKR